MQCLKSSPPRAAEFTRTVRISVSVVTYFTCDENRDIRDLVSEGFFGIGKGIITFSSVAELMIVCLIILMGRVRTGLKKEDANTLHASALFKSAFGPPKSMT